jgi:thiamine biosynthesis lipoprotein
MNAVPRSPERLALHGRERLALGRRERLALHGRERLALRGRERLALHAIAALAFVAASVGACSPPAPDNTRAHKVERVGASMGSDLRLTAWTADERAAQSAFDAVFAEFERLEALMSVWRPGSDVLRINAAAGDHAVAVNADVRDVLRIARQVSEWTDGTFDVTFGALTDVWKFDHDQDNTVPSPEAIRARLPLIDYRQIEIDDRAGTVFLTRKGMRVHLGGIGKGYAVGHATAILRRAGLRDFMIQAGGDLYVGGTKDGRPWKLGINDPRGPDGQTFATIELTDSTFSTSGDYARAFIRDGVRYHHILDPRIGQPARLCRSVTIASDSPVLADAVAKGVFILGPEKGMALIERLPNLEGVIVSAQNDVLVSSGLKEKFVLLARPTDTP